MAVRPRAERHHRVVHRHHRFSLRGDVTVHIGGGGRASLVLDVGHHDPRCVVLHKQPCRALFGNDKL
jgi:hypothetical protein